MSFATLTKETIITCSNPICKGTFSVIVYVFGDPECSKINAANLVRLTGNTPYFCPICGNNLGKK